MNNTSFRPILFLAVVFASLFCKLFIVDILYVSGNSMSPTLSNGSFVIINRLAYGITVPATNTYLVRWGEPAVNDIIVYPLDGRIVVKRCIATAGTKLDFIENSGYSVRAGERDVPLSETQFRRMVHTQNVPPGTVFTLGDNNKESRDSRDYGFVSLDSIRGKVVWK